MDGRDLGMCCEIHFSAHIMIRLLIIFFGLLYSSSLVAQSSYFFSIETTPLVSYRHIKSDGNGNFENRYGISAEKYKNKLDTIECPIFGFSAGFRFNLKAKKFIFSFGWDVKQLGERSNQILPKGHYEQFAGNMILVYDGPGDFKYRHLYTYIGLPMRISYQIMNKKFKVNLIGEGSLNYLVRHYDHDPDNVDELYFTPHLKSDYAVFNKRIFGIKFGFNCTKRLNGKYEIFIQPNYFINITPDLSIENELYQYNYCAGLTLGLNFVK